MQHATPIMFMMQAYLQHQTEPQALLYLTVNGINYRIEKTAGALPNVLRMNSIQELVNDAKAIAMATPYYRMLRSSDRMPMSRDEILRLILGLNKLGYLEISGAQNVTRTA